MSLKIKEQERKKDEEYYEKQLMKSRGKIEEDYNYYHCCYS
jgi:hypothetical protein